MTPRVNISNFTLVSLELLRIIRDCDLIFQENQAIAWPSNQHTSSSCCSTSFHEEIARSMTNRRDHNYKREERACDAYKLKAFTREFACLNLFKTVSRTHN